MVRWEAWGEAAFARAAREGKPILLSLTAAWCRACQEMDRTTYADATVAALVSARFVPVRVDADRRPDINERYNLGGWPTTAFLTAGGALITGGTFVTAERMPGVLARVADAFAARAGEWARTAAFAAEDAEHTECGDAADVDAVFATYDEEFGGFGVEPKFPLVAPLHLALALFRDSGEPQWRGVVERTLDAMWTGGLWDARAGGFFRYAATRDWQRPQQEKLLETNAALLGAYADAADTFGRAVDRDRTAAIARFIITALRDARGGYHASDAAPVMFMDGNAQAVSALFKASITLADDALGREALESFERVLLACYKPGQGVAHEPGGVRGLLSDHVFAIAALLDAHELTGGEPYQMMAEELGHYVVSVLEPGPGTGLLDRVPQPDDIGLLRSRRRPFVANAEAAVALSRLQRISRDYDFSGAAAGALYAARRQAAGQGPLAGHYILAARQVR
jgi:uncharacterized protein YyaL (SSP411 family)